MIKTLLSKQIKKRLVNLVLFLFKVGNTNFAKNALMSLEKKFGGYHYHKLLKIKVSSVKNYCARHPNPNNYQILEPKKKILIGPVHILGNYSRLQICYLTQHTVEMPEKYLATIEQAYILGGTELIVTKDNWALYDEIAF